MQREVHFKQLGADDRPPEVIENYINVPAAASLNYHTTSASLCMIYRAMVQINDGSSVVSGLEPEAFLSIFHQVQSISLYHDGLYSLFAQDALQYCYHVMRHLEYRQIS
ncbi:hypothetical protein AVEN_27409-1 [Araneus ventricosus]|uniref:Uncharacterized protein n=1 Tax=Araneus ventricosus TaxID=182803 RepID=A0A4Y2QFL3_ARAVE|nr:hypothetical protein AVEN_27409-1 [Araneus ventricosus]